MGILISGTTGIDMGNTSVSNASQIEVQNSQLTPFSGFKNYIINGNFYVWQRGTIFSITTVSNNYTADRMSVTLNQVSSGTLSVKQNIVQKEVGNNYCLEINATPLVTTAAIDITQIMESLIARKLAGKTVTLSVRAKVLSGTSLCSLKLIEGTNTDAYPTGGIINSSNITLTTSYQTFAITVNVASTTTSLAYRLTTPSAFNGVVYIQNVQLEEGSIATPFENRPYGLELSLCQRYYWSVSGTVYGQFNNHGTPQLCSLVLKHPVTMRIVPTVTSLSGSILPSVDSTTTYLSVGNGGIAQTSSGTFSAEL